MQIPPHSLFGSTIIQEHTMALYELALMGAPSGGQIDELAERLSQVVELFGLRLGQEVAWSVCPTDFDPPQRNAAAVAFFGAAGVSETGLSAVLAAGVPVLPIASGEDRINEEIPDSLKPLNCLTYTTDGPQRIATALLECVGLLPRQRRVFLSYRRSEAREAALQLFDALSGRLFDVFLDTHGIAPGEDFQAVLWHRLCDSDVLMMIDTPSYFASRWTSAEFGRALAKGISVLRIGMPGVIPSPRTATASQINLTDADVDGTTGRISDGAIEQICTLAEAARSQSLAVRSLNSFSHLRQAVERIGGTVVGVGLHRAVFIQLPDGRDIVLHPITGVPTSLTLQEAADHARGRPVAVFYDHIGLHPNWLSHLSWLGNQIQAIRWVRASEAAWSLGGWDV